MSNFFWTIGQLLKTLGLFFGVLTWLDLLFITLLVNLHGFTNITIIDKVIMVLCAVMYFIAKAIFCWQRVCKKACFMTGCADALHQRNKHHV